MPAADGGAVLQPPDQKEAGWVVVVGWVKAPFMAVVRRLLRSPGSWLGRFLATAGMLWLSSGPLLLILLAPVCARPRAERGW